MQFVSPEAVLPLRETAFTGSPEEGQSRQRTVIIGTKENRATGREETFLAVINLVFKRHARRAVLLEWAEQGAGTLCFPPEE